MLYHLDDRNEKEKKTYLNQQHDDFSGSATTKLKSKLLGRAKPVLIPSQPSSTWYSPVCIRLYTSCVTILNASSTLTPVLADVSTKCRPFCSANAFASSLLTSLRAPLFTRSILQPVNANTGLCGSMCRFASIILQSNG